MDGDGAGPNAITVVFDTFKKETFTPSKGLKQLQRRLKMQYNIIENKEGIEQSIYNVRNTQIAVFWGPREKFTKSEFAVIKNYLEDGGSVFMLLGEGGEGKYGTNINFLLEEYGIYINSDCAVRSVYHKYLHPKEVLISNGVLNRELSHAIARLPGASKSERESVDLSSTQHDLHGGLEIVFPYGATLNVQKPAIPLLSTGQESYPLNRPVLAVYDGKLLHKQGKLIVLGSDKVFNDEWLLKEENGKLLDVLMKWLVPGQEIKLNSNDAEDPDINEYHHVPDTGALASRVRCCLQEAEEIPRDFASMFDDKLFKFDTDEIPEAIKLYKQLDVKHEVLTLIPPQFEAPLPPLQPAVFPPALREPPPPALDLFDLDEQFASERVRLAKLTNKCKDPDSLDFYVKHSAEILGVTNKLPEGKKTAKHCLEVILRELVNWKRMAPDTSLSGNAIGQHL
ncbi:hypothetical protein GUITHDRAFT_91822 [Guillardia theta CCMP2712]|uniref:ABC-type uncharacterized transport system domain-containing protein n=3 Tax=Guillardia theta TaxID=55529 RepID=L1K104_GUITC|nr:hypothetical protein GUITHDRAFT_91822 [Guillardia theta CCMP2712]EKX54239.1 hypothetical protein GUITHDRAFT_91822 [Guillardia theta CCMP2712]|eukprot:XP_005841219.1 hypothetical protein GUITHDRAFT_91822 [Guillardia theta CCMP2712]